VLRVEAAVHSQRIPKNMPLVSRQNWAKLTVVVAEETKRKTMSCALPRPDGHTNSSGGCFEEVAGKLIDRIPKSEDAPGHAIPREIQRLDNSHNVSIGWVGGPTVPA